MKVRCDLCEKIDTIDDNSLLAKKIIYRKVQSYLCEACYERIKINTLKRHETGKFRLYHTYNKDDAHDKNETL